MGSIIRESAAHVGTSFIEIYQNCNIFNDGAFFAFTDRATQKETSLFLEDGKPLVFGKNGELGIKIDGLQPRVVSLEDSDVSLNDLWIHDEKDIYKAQILTRFFDDPRSNANGYFPRPFGVLYAIDRPNYEHLLLGQIKEAIAQKGKGDLDSLLAGSVTWQVD